MVFNPVNYVLIEKERIVIDGEPYYRLYFYEPMSGQTIPVLSPIREDKAVKLFRRE